MIELAIPTFATRGRVPSFQPNRMEINRKRTKAQNLQLLYEITLSGILNYKSSVCYGTKGMCVTSSYD